MYSKLIFFFLLTLLAENSLTIRADENAPSQRMYEEEITNLLECVRQFIKDGIQGFSFDPLKIPLLPLIFNTDSISSSMLLSNISLEGLAGFEIDRGTVTIIPPALDIQLSFNEIKFGLNYNGKIDILRMIKLYGKGNVSMVFNELIVGAHVSLKIVNGISVKVKLELPTTTAVIHGLFNDEYMSDIISRQLTDTINVLGQEQEENINAFINDLIEQLMNNQSASFLKKWNFNDIVEMVNNKEFSCDTGVETTVRFLNETITDFLTKTSAKDIQKIFYNEL